MARICVLDDDLDGVLLMQRILERKGHLVRIFTQEEEALFYLQEHRVDLALLDINFGGPAGGMALAVALRRVDPNLRILLLAHYPTGTMLRNAHDAGALDCCAKPIDKRELECKVAVVLSMNQAAHHIEQERLP